ncbi:ATP-binding protein [Rhizobium leguminosarum]|uniref:ATP-binding protein n=1 Tax=Rhizobium leguminosarum TaxID=384 RepID=UPI001FDFFEAB|nr:winged helix-turn-helix domain-containing protein [Rhizobium leguminosarum]
MAVRVGSRALEILAALIERPGELVGKAELVSRVWPDTFVEESNLKVNVAALRRALGDAPGDMQYIATVSGRGYRFVFPVRISGQSDTSVTATSQGARTNNLPVSTTRLVGRGDAVDAIRCAVEVSRLLTIVGPGGVGKTRLALAIADQLTAAYHDGIWFVDLATVNDATLVPTAIATAMGLRVHSANIKAAVAAFATDREFMLVLDNCEHVIEAVASCAETLLAAAARVRILATSREPLRVVGEQVYRLPPLETPPEVSELSAAQALAFPAVELFVERAAASRGEFKLNDGNAPVAAEICRRLDGLALAIELAAPRLDAFSTRELLDLLADQSHVLSDRRSGDPRHHTLAAGAMACSPSLSASCCDGSRSLQAPSVSNRPAPLQSTRVVPAPDAFTVSRTSLRSRLYRRREESLGRTTDCSIQPANMRCRNLPRAAKATACASATPNISSNSPNAPRRNGKSGRRPNGSPSTGERWTISAVLWAGRSPGTAALPPA